MSSTLSSNRTKTRVHYMAHDWPDDMQMSDDAFADYAATLEKQDFEDDVRGLSSTLHQLVTAREDTINKLRASADYLDSIWTRCKIGRGVGTSASVVGGSLTIAGGILTLTTAGAAAPLLIAGIATSSVGAATNIGTSIIEKAINSKQVKDMSNALSIDRDLTLKIESQIDDLRRYKDSAHLGVLLVLVEEMLGSSHILVAILKSIFSYDMSGVIGMSAKFFSEGVRNTLYSISEAKSVAAAVGVAGTTVASSGQGMLQMAKEGCEIASKSGVGQVIAESPGAAGCAAAGVAAAGAAVAAASTVKDCTSSTSTQVCRTSASAVTNATSAPLKYNPLGPDIFLETGKVVGQNSTRLAGKVIVGVSAAFLVWDAIDLGVTVADLIRKKGSQAAKILRDKADELEEALNETKAHYSFEMMAD